MRAWIVIALCVAACDDVDPCASQSGTCIALEVDGALSVDQLAITAAGAFTLRDAPSPAMPRASAVALPVRLAVLPGDHSGDFSLIVRGLLGGVVVGEGMATGTLTSGKHLSATVTLTALAGDLAAPPDLARDFAGSDLADVPCDITTQNPCPSDQKCIWNGTRGVCRPNGTKRVGELCSTRGDDCIRGTTCLQTGICEQYCSTDTDCTESPVAVGGTPEPANGPHCVFNEGTGGPKLCSLPCNPVAKLGASGCPSASNCVYSTSAMFPEYTFCLGAVGTIGEGQACSGSTDCALGLNCAFGTSGAKCRAVCRASTDADCAAPNVCKPGIGGSPPMFGYCCPAAGC
jgi:hypothetical protein